MSDKLHKQQRQITRFLVANLLIAIAVPLVLGGYFGGGFSNVGSYLIALIVSALLLSLINRRYGLYLFWSMLFLLYLLKEIVVSNIALAWLIIQPKLKLDPGIIAVPLTVTTSLEIIVLSLAIASTPGTLIVELGQEASGRYVLYVHTINVGNPEEFRATIQNGFERMILRISRGATT